MGLYQYIREQAHRQDIIGDLGRWMKENYGERPDHDSEAFSLAAQEYESYGEWTKQDAINRLNDNEVMQYILKTEPRLNSVISDLIKIQNHRDYDRDDEYSRFKERILDLVGFGAEKEEIRDAKSYDVMIYTIVDLLPPDRSDLYPDDLLPENMGLDI